MAGGKKGRDADGDYLTGVTEKIMSRVNPHVMKDHLAGETFDGGVSRSVKPRRPKVKTGRAGAFPKAPK
jgi:hypothetical protein